MPHLAGQTERDLASWAMGEGARAGAARVLARALLAELAGRPIREAPARELLERAKARFDCALPRAEANRDTEGTTRFAVRLADGNVVETVAIHQEASHLRAKERWTCLLYTSPSPRDRQKSRMPSSA